METDEKIRTDVIDGCTLITTTAWRSNNNAFIRGVGIMLSKYAPKALADVKA